MKTGQVEKHGPAAKAAAIYTAALKSVVMAMVFASGVCVFVMMTTTCADVILRRFNMPLTGAYDIVKICGALTLALALPYTTAVKGHVAIEYFFHKLNRKGRIAVDFVMRALAITLFCFLGWRSFMYGNQLRNTGQVTQTLKLPVYWVPWVIGLCCFVVILVTLHHLLHPRREMIKP